jgi:hypothetical protein
VAADLGERRADLGGGWADLGDSRSWSWLSKLELALEPIFFYFIFLLMEAGVVSCPPLKQTFTKAGYLTAAVVS